MKKKIATILTAAVIGATAFTTIVSAASGDITVVSREDGSGTRGAFVELFGIEEEKDGEKVDMTTDEASVTNSTSVMMTTVAGDENAIGYISLGSLDDTVKAVKIDGVEATVDNVSNDSYKIARPFNILTSDKESDAAKDFVNYIMSTPPPTASLALASWTRTVTSTTTAMLPTSLPTTRQTWPRLRSCWKRLATPMARATPPLSTAPTIPATMCLWQSTCSRLGAIWALP